MDEARTDPTPRSAENSGKSLLPDVTSVLKLAEDAFLFVHDEFGKIVFASEGCENVTGFTPSECTGMTPEQIVHPDDLQRVQDERLSQIAANRDPTKLTFRTRHKDGRYVWIECIGAAVPSDSDEVRIVTWNRDVSGAQAYSKRLTVMNELHRAVLSNPLSASSIAEAAVRHLSQLVPIHRASVAEFDRENNEAVFLATWQTISGGPGDLGRIPLDMMTDVIDSDVVETYQQDLRNVPNPSELLSTLLLAGIRSTLSVPLMVRDSLLGVLNIGSKKPGAFTDEHILTTREVADVVALSLQHARWDLQARRSSERLSFSEDRWGRLVLGHHDPIMIVVAGSIVYANEAVANMIGADSAVACVGLHVLDLVVEEDRHRVETAAELILTGKHVSRFPLGIRKLDGERLVVEAWATPVIWETGQALQVVVSDITERQRASTALRDSETLLSSISRNISDGIFRSTLDGRLVYVNEAFARLFGYESTSEVLQLVSADLYADSHERERLKDLVSVDGSMQGQEVEFKKKDGSRFWGLVSSTAVRDENGEIEFYDGAVSDITLFKLQQAELVQARDHAEELSRLKTAFLANMSHEIRTPLSSIIGFAGILAEQATDENKEFAELIYISGQRLMETLNSVLDLAQLEGNTMRLSSEDVDLSRQVDQSLVLFRNAAVQRGLDLRFEDHTDEPVRVAVDRAALSRVLNNLLGNANKFTRVGAITVRIHADEAFGYVTISDTGVGISETFLPHVFDEFAQESWGLQRTFEGSGLGLTITKRLVELMGGSISVTSSKGKGSTFQLRFRKSVSQETSDIGTVGGVHDEESRSVLVVEDNSEMRELLRHLLARKFTVGLTASRREALAEIKRRPYDVVLLDVNLGEETTGVELLSELRDLIDGRTMAAIACTAYALPGDREKFLAAGFDDYLGKPFSTENLFEVLDRVTAVSGT